MNIEPFPTKLFNRLKELGVLSVELCFSGGSDEGFLDIQFEYPSLFDNEKEAELAKLESEIEEWAWEVYAYNGAGDGNSYGDNITYDFEKMTVEHNEWYSEITYTPPKNMTLKVSK